MSHTYRIGDRIRIINTTKLRADIGELGVVVATEHDKLGTQRLQIRFLSSSPRRHAVWNTEWVLAACVILSDKRE